MAALVVGERFEVHALTGYSIGERSRSATDYRWAVAALDAHIARFPTPPLQPRSASSRAT